MQTEIKFEELPIPAQNAITSSRPRPHGVQPDEIEKDFSFYKDGNAYTVMEKTALGGGELYLAFWNGSYWEDKFGFVEEFDM